MYEKKFKQYSCTLQHHDKQPAFLFFNSERCSVNVSHRAQITSQKLGGGGALKKK